MCQTWSSKNTVRERPHIIFRYQTWNYLKSDLIWTRLIFESPYRFWYEMESGILEISENIEPDFFLKIHLLKLGKILSLLITFFTDFSIGWHFWKMVKMWYKFQVYEFVIYTIFLSLKSFKLIWLNSCMSKFTYRFQYELESEIVLNTEQPSTFSIIIFF